MTLDYTRPVTPPGALPRGWFIPTGDGPDYMSDVLGKKYPFGELKDVAAA